MAATSPLVAELVPVPRSRLIGREREIVRGRAWLLDAAVPLLTLTGPGGVGKTRLALAIAHDVAPHFADGVVWVDLAPLADPALVLPTLARAAGILASPGTPLLAELLRRLRARQALLLLDNCEHLLPAVAALAGQLLPACPAVQILATSRAPLRVRGEQAFPVDPLPLPDATSSQALDRLAANDAVRLFVAHARTVCPDFALDATNAAAVAAICCRLDGLPLAIELAAARVTMLSPDALLAQMTDRLCLLTGGPRDAPARQQTIRDTIVWSYDLLASEEQVLFRRLAVFAGGFTLEAAEMVAGGGRREAGGTVDISPSASRLPPPASAVFDLVAALIDKSLLRREELAGGEPRFAMLETIRELGLERLAEAREDAAVRARHAAWVRRLVEALDLFRTMQGDLAAMRCLAPEQDNLRQALAWFAARGDRLALNYLSAALSIFWCSYGQYAEARRWLQLAIADDRDVPALTRAQAWNEAGWLAMVQGELDLAQSLREHGLTLAREAGDPFRIGGALLGSGILAFWLGDLPRATAMLEEAERTFLAIADEVAAAPVKAGSAETVLACIALMTGDVPRAVARFEEAMWRTRTSGAAADQSYVVCGLGYARLQQGALPAAAACFLEATALSWSIGDDAFLARIFWATAAVAAGSGLAKSGAHLAGVADALDARTGSAMWPNDRVVAEGCLASLESALGPAAVSDLRRAGASLSVAQGVALARTVAERVLGAACVTATWQATGAPAPEVTDGDVAFDRLAPADPASGEPGDLLSKREREVLSLLCQRLTDREIADRLYLSPRTVEHHVASILAKLDVASRRDAAALAARLGLL